MSAKDKSCFFASFKNRLNGNISFWIGLSLSPAHSLTKKMHRSARSLFDFFSHKTKFEPSVSGSNNRLDVRLGDKALKDNVESPAHAGLNTASRLIEDGGELIRLPMTWLKTITVNWPIYLICGSIICLAILFIYCKVRRSSPRSSMHQLVEMATVMAQRSVPPMIVQPSEKK